MLCSEPQVNHEVADLFTAGLEESKPHYFDDSLLAGLRSPCRTDATNTAQKTLRAGVLATENILQMAGWIQEMKSRLSRKEFGAFVKGLLQWVGESARKYLDIAKAFEGFDLSRLSQLEPFTLLKLRTKRYAPVVEKLREQPVITPNVVQDLIKEVLPKQPRKKATEPISGWKQARSGGARYYNVLLHDEETGLSIEQQAQAEGILPQRVIAEAIALRAFQKQAELQLHVVDVVADGEQPDSVQEHDQAHTQEVDEDALLPRVELESDRLREQASELDQSKQPINNAIASLQISELAEEVAVAQPEVSEYVAEQPRAIAVPPEALLAGEDKTEIQWLLNAPIHQVEEIIRSVSVGSAYRALYLLNQFQSGDRRFLQNKGSRSMSLLVGTEKSSVNGCPYFEERIGDEKRMDLLEQRVTEYHISIGVAKSPDKTEQPSYEVTGENREILVKGCPVL